MPTQRAQGQRKRKAEEAEADAAPMEAEGAAPDAPSPNPEDLSESAQKDKQGSSTSAPKDKKASSRSAQKDKEGSSKSAQKDKKGSSTAAQKEKEDSSRSAQKDKECSSASASKDQEVSSTSGAWSVLSFGWLVRLIPKPTKSKIRTARATLVDQYPNVLAVESLTTGVCLTLRERRNKHAVSKNIHNLLDSVFPECSMEIAPTDSAADGHMASNVAELKYKGLVTTFGQHFDQDVRLIQAGTDVRSFFFNGEALHINTDHQDVATLLALEDTAQSCAIRYLRLGIEAVGASLPSLPPLPTQSVDDFSDVTVVAPLSEPGLRIAGGGLFAGAHGEACYVQGQVAQDVLAFLQGDEFLHLDGNTLQKMELQSFDPPRRTKDWQCRPAVQQDGVQADKMEISGALSAQPASGRMNGLGLPPLKMKRVLIWRQQLFDKNADRFQILKSKLDRCTASFAGTNVDHLLGNSADSIFLSAGQIFLTRVPPLAEASCDNPRGALFEDRHIDGAGGMLHLGLSIYSKRLLKVWPVGQRPVGYMQRPGSFWLTNSAAFEHQAVHVQPVASTDVFRFGELDDLSCSVMMRSCFFPHDRARNANSIVTPQAAFQACTKCIAAWIRDQGSQLELPTLQELEQALARD